MRDVVGSVLRVKPDSLREDQPLTDLGLDSLMGVEIETMLETSIGVALPPTSLMRARTIGQIATLIAEQMGSDADSTVKTAVVAEEVVETSELDLDSISDEDLDLLLGGVAEAGMKRSWLGKPDFIDGSGPESAVQAMAGKRGSTPPADHPAPA